MGKNLSKISETLIFLMLLLSILLTITPKATAQEKPVIAIEPSTLEFGPEPCVGTLFKVECWIYNITDLYGVDIQITWDTDWIRYVNHTKKIPVETYPDGILHSPTIPVHDDVNETGALVEEGAAPGTLYWLAEASMSPAEPFDGSGIAFEMWFNVTNQPGVGEPDVMFEIGFTSVTLGDVNGEPILYEARNATVIIHAKEAPPPVELMVVPDFLEFGPEPCIGQQFTINIEIHNVTNLYGVDIQITWDTDWIRYVNHTKKIPVETYPDGILHSPTISVHDDVDETGGLVEEGAAPGTLYWLAEASMLPAEPFDGSGIAFEMTFEIVNQPEADEADAIVTIGFTYSILSDSAGLPIDHEAYNGTVVIHPKPLPPLLKVTPEHVEEVPECYTFTSDVYLMGENGTDLDPFWDVAGFDIYFNFDPTLLEAVEVTIDPDGWFASFWPNGILVVKQEINNDEGWVWIAFLGIPGDYGEHTPPSGKGRLFTVTFHAISESSTYPPETIVLGLNPVTVAGYPHPERDYPPWNGSDSAPPLPHVIENATYTPFYAGPPYEVDVSIDVGKIHFPGEIAEFYIQTSYVGRAVNATYLNASLYYGGMFYEDLTPLAQFIDTGFYRITYVIPSTAQAGEYVLRVQVQYFKFYGIAIEGFQISPTLSSWNALIIAINGTIAQIKTDVGIIRLNLTNINATLSGLIIDSKGEILAEVRTSRDAILAELDALNITVIDVQNTVVTINSTLGILETKLDNLNATIIEIHETTATISTTLGTIEAKLDNLNATIVDLIIGEDGVMAKIDTALGQVLTKLDNLNTAVTSVDGNVADVKTSVGEIKESMGALQGMATYGIIAACIFSLIAAIVAILLFIKTKK